MALKGTLRDFGIADILQLISQQTKTGVLHLQAKDEEVHVSFHEGEVVRAEHRSRNRKDLLGGMLVAAGLLTEAVLQQALEEQKRTLRRLGDILIDTGAISKEDMRQMAQLQTTETLYRLFRWKSGTYEFEQGMVDWDRDSIAPIRAESVLMEGFRMVDEWPGVRRVIPSPYMTFDRVRSLSPDAGPERSRGDSLGENEQKVMALVVPGRTVEQLTDLSRLGEFETSKALYNLVQAGHLRAIAARREDSGRSSPSIAARLATFGTRLAMSAVIIALLLAIAWFWRGTGGEQSAGSGVRVQDPAVQRVLAGPQQARIRAALEVFELEHGGYPESLRDVVTAGLLDEADLRWPWDEPYVYRKADDRPRGYVLLPPLR